MSRYRRIPSSIRTVGKYLRWLRRNAPEMVADDRCETIARESLPGLQESAHVELVRSRDREYQAGRVRGLASAAGQA